MPRGKDHPVNRLVHDVTFDWKVAQWTVSVQQSRDLIFLVLTFSVRGGELGETRRGVDGEMYWSGSLWV